MPVNDLGRTKATLDARRGTWDSGYGIDGSGNGRNIKGD